MLVTPHLLEIILSPSNLNKAYKAVVRNNGSGGIDKMSCEQLLPWLNAEQHEEKIKYQRIGYRELHHNGTGGGLMVKGISGE